MGASLLEFTGRNGNEKETAFLTSRYFWSETIAAIVFDPLPTKTRRHFSLNHDATDMDVVSNVLIGTIFDWKVENIFPLKIDRSIHIGQIGRYSQMQNEDQFFVALGPGSEFRFYNPG